MRKIIILTFIVTLAALFACEKIHAESNISKYLRYIESKEDFEEYVAPLESKLPIECYEFNSLTELAEKTSQSTYNMKRIYAGYINDHNMIITHYDVSDTDNPKVVCVIYIELYKYGFFDGNGEKILYSVYKF